MSHENGTRGKTTREVCSWNVAVTLPRQGAAQFGAQQIIVLQWLGLGTCLSGESLKGVLEPTEGDQVQHFAWAGAKNAALIVRAKSDAFKAVLEVVPSQGGFW